MHIPVRWFALLLSLVTFAAGAADPATQPARLTPGDHARKLIVDGRERSYLVHVPASYDAAKPTPVVLAFHGAWMNGSLMAWFSGLSPKSDSAGFILVYPNGTGLSDTQLFFNAFDHRPGAVDDVKFTAKLLDDLESRANVDPRRVFATGMSNGGMMCYRLAADLADRIAAIAPVAGTQAFDDPRPSRAVPVLHFHGTADKIVPYAGSTANATGKVLRFKGVEETIDTWVKLDGCGAKPDVTEISDAAHDNTSATRRVYGNGRDGAEVVLYEIKGMGHTWPGRPALPFLGGVTRNVDANDVIWEFFEKHPMK